MSNIKTKNQKPKTKLPFMEAKVKKRTKFSSPTKNKGISILLAALILSSVLAIGLGISAILVLQLRTMGEVGKSTISIFTADSGIERGLYALYKESVPLPFLYSGYLDLNQNGSQDSGEPTFTVEGKAPGGDCQATYYCIKSTGNYSDTSRSIETKY